MRLCAACPVPSPTFQRQSIALPCGQHWSHSSLTAVPPATCPAATCSVLIRERDGTPVASMQALSLAEVRLYQGATYTQVPASQLTFAQSSTATTTQPAANCNAGSTTSLCTTNGPSSGDASPWLRVSYACPAGVSTVTRVDVVNVASPCTSACSRLTSFTLDFVNAAGRRDMQSYTFSAALPSYTVYAYPAGECSSDCTR